MGRVLIEAILASSACQLVAAFARSGSAIIGHDAAVHLGKRSGVLVSDLASTPSVLQQADVLIDFSAPTVTPVFLEACCAARINMVIGTTGLTAEDEAQIRAGSKQIAIVHSANMSLGIDVLGRLVKLAAELLGPAYDAEILEMHHRMKIDAPSGTALMLGKIVSDAKAQAFDTAAVYSRSGKPGPRPSHQIGFSSLRGGDVLGEHTVILAGSGERIEISHKTSDRSVYAQGALRAAAFLSEKQTGVYTMHDVLRSPLA